MLSLQVLSQCLLLFYAIASTSALDGNLLLSPYIEKDEEGKGRNAAKVASIPGAQIMRSYSGFITVNKQTNSNLFFWFIPNANKAAPTLLYMVGGPGHSSIWYSFVESGPFGMVKDGEVKKKLQAWTKNYNLLLVDSPVGTGYSFADKPGYSKSDQEVAQDVTNFLPQFFKLFPRFQKNDLYLVGWSYAAKVVAHMAKQIRELEQIKESSVNYQFKGIVLLAPLVDPADNLDTANFLYYHGLLNKKETKQFAEEEANIGSLIKEGNYLDAATKYFGLFFGTFPRMTGSSDPNNVLQTTVPEYHNYPTSFLNSSEVKEALHVDKGQPFTNFNQEVLGHMMGEFLKPAFSELEGVLDYCKVMLVYGNLDIVTSAPSGQKLVDRLNWSGAEEFKAAEKKFWPKEGKVLAYVRKAKNFYHVVIRGASHTLSADQPETTLNIMKDFTSGTL